MPRKNWRAPAILAGAAAFISGGVALAGTPVTWNANAVGSWTDGSLWSISPAFPNNFQTTTYDAVIDSPKAMVELDAPITVDHFTLQDGTLAGGSELAVTSAGLWLGGTIAGLGTINIGSSLAIDGADHTFSNYTINIGSLATATWISHSIVALTGVEGGVINNAGTFDDQTDDDWLWGNLQTPIFNNTGLFLKSAGSDGFAKSFWPVMNNSGEIHVQASGLWLAGGGTSGGSFNVDEGALLQISDFKQNFAGAGAPTTIFSSTATLSSLGSVVFSHSSGSSVTEFNGTYDAVSTVIDTHDPDDLSNEGRVTFTSSALVNSNFDGSLQVISGKVRFETAQPFISFTDGTFSGGTLSTANDLFFDAMTWSGGTICSDSNSNISTGALAFVGTDFKQLKGVNLYNGIGSHATISESSLSMVGAALINLTDATFDFQGDVSLINGDPINTVSSFYNDGTLMKSGGTGLSALSDVALYNTGTVLVQSGMLFLDGGGTHTGTIIISGGAVLELGDGMNLVVHDFQSGAVVSGMTRSLMHVVGWTTFENGSRADVDELDVESPLVFSGTLNTTGGLFIGGDSLAAGNAGSLTIVGGGAVSAGPQTAVWNNGRIDFFDGSFSTGALQAIGGGQVILSPGHNKVLQTTSILITGNSKLDLADNQAIVHYTGLTPINGIRQQIRSAYNHGSWNGNGITSSLANATEGLGYGESTSLGITTFGGVGLSGNNVLIQYTYLGDANLDGVVDVTDLLAIARHFNTAGDLWTGGDFNYDGTVDIYDLRLLAQNWGKSIPDLQQPVEDLAPLLASLGLPAVAIPEPVLIPMIPAIVLMLRRRRRHRKSLNSSSYA